jgi:hypothetical protein
MGCLPQSASFKVIELDFLTYLLIVVKPWSYVREFELSMQLVLMSPFTIHRGSLLTSSCVECCHSCLHLQMFLRPLVLSWASEFNHVYLMKLQPKLLFVLVIIISFTLFLSCCSCLFFIDFPLHPEQNIYKYIALLKSRWNYISNKWSSILNGARRKKLCPFYFSAACCSENLRTYDLRCFGYNRL